MDSSEEMQDIQKTSQKIEKISKKEGLRDGISAGRDSNFQESFDKGFEEGLKNGFLLGRYKGTLMALSKQTSTVEDLHPILISPNSGSCEICKNNVSMQEEDIDNIMKIQNNCYQNNVEVLRTFYKELK